MKDEMNDLKKIDAEQLYYQALFIAFKKFIEQEKEGLLNTELRFVEKIKAARTLYKDKY